MFKYGDSWEEYPINPKEIWAVDQHIIACGDIEAGNADELLASYGEPDYAFVDPPWNKGNAKAFLTKANIDRTVDFNVLIDRVLGLVMKAKNDVLIEFGNQHIDSLLEGIRSSNGSVNNVWDVFYYGSNPCKMVHCSWGKATIVPYGECTYMDEMKVPPWFFKHLNVKGKTLFDPCMGQGLAACTAQGAGMRALGLELNPRRAAVTLRKLAKLTGATPVKVGTLLK